MRKFFSTFRRKINKNVNTEQYLSMTIYFQLEILSNLCPRQVVHIDSKHSKWKESGLWIAQFAKCLSELVLLIVFFLLFFLILLLLNLVLLLLVERGSGSAPSPVRQQRWIVMWHRSLVVLSHFVCSSEDGDFLWGVGNG